MRWARASLIYAGILLAAGGGRAVKSQSYKHFYYDCAVGSQKECQRVRYSVRSNTLGAVVPNPQQASAVVSKARDFEVKGKKLTHRDLCGRDFGLELIDLDEDNPTIAGYEIEGKCGEEAGSFWLARHLREMDEIEVAGVLVRTSNAEGEYLMVDEVLVAIERPRKVGPAERVTPTMLTAVGGEFVDGDPFDKKKSLLRASYGDSPDELESFLRNLDVFSCVVAELREKDSVDWKDKTLLRDAVKLCSKRYPKPEADSEESGPRLNLYQKVKHDPNAEAGEALLELLPLVQPRFVRPTLIPVEADSDLAGFEDWLASEQKEEDDWNASITANSTSNETESEDQVRLSVDSSFSNGTYPSQLRFDLGAQVEFEDAEVEEEVTSMRLNYDYYFKPWFEVYAFAERLSNKFLGIDQRWEGGAGVLFEYDLRHSANRGERDDFCASQGLEGYSGRAVVLTREARRRVEQHRAKIREQFWREELFDRDTELYEDYCEYNPGIVKRNVRFQASMAFSVFADFEEPEELTITPRPITEDGEPDENREDPLKPIKVSPDSSQLLRFTVRPKLTFRPAGNVTFEVLHYWKLSGDEEGPLDEDGSDVRRELQFRFELGLNDADPEVSIEGSWTRYYDSQPPRVSAVDVRDLLGLEPVPDDSGALPPPLHPRARSFTGTNEGGRYAVDGLVADDEHTVVKVGIKVKF